MSMAGMANFNYQRSRHDIRHFYEWLSPEYKWAEHIEQWINMYSNRGTAQIHRTCIIAPRSHSKSATLRVKLLHMCLFEKWHNNPMEIWLFSASIRQASNRLEEIKTDMRRHPELRKYIDEKKCNRHKITFTNGAWIQATGVGSAVRGEHPAVVALDDVLAEMGDMTMDSVREWFRKTVQPMLDPGSSLFVVGTPMAFTDLYHTEMLTETAKKIWKSGTWSCFPYYDEQKADPNIPDEDLTPLWPEFRSTAFLLEQKLSMNDDLSFAQEYLCKVMDDDSQVFNRSLIRENIDIGAEGGLNGEFHQSSRFVLGFDPAHGIGKDYSVLICLRQDADGSVHFVDMWRRNDFSPDRQADVIIEWAERYKAPVAAEDVGFQRLYETIIQQKGSMLEFIPSKASNRGLKQGLLNRLRVWFEQKRFGWPFADSDTRAKVTIVLRELEEHVWKDGLITDVGKHNDTVMALAHAIDQFKPKSNATMPMATGTTGMGGWGKDKKTKKSSASRRPNKTDSKHVRFRA